MIVIVRTVKTMKNDFYVQLFHLSSRSLVITFYVIWVMTSQDGHSIVTKLKIMHIFGLIWPNWLKNLFTYLVNQIKHYSVLNMVGIATN